MYLSYVNARRLLTVRATAATSAEISLDLGISHLQVQLTAGGIVAPDGKQLTWESISLVAENPNGCYLVNADGEVEKIQRYSEQFSRLYSLMPVAYEGRESWPTMLISGIPMHRIKDTSPQFDTQEKVRAARPVRGRVLDTATGLGYTAIAAAHQAEQVTTVELDPMVLEVARLNPWSQELFEKENIRQLIGDAFEVVMTLPSEAFDTVIHDPPMFNLAGHLYSEAFYRDLLRILRPRGKIYHYIGNPNSKSGRNVTRSVMRRIQEAGFIRCRPAPKAFGLVAFKPTQ